MRARRDRGATLVELLVALGLAAALTAFLFAVTRSQLSALDAGGQVMQVQQGARAAAQFVESLLRRACGGAARGAIGVNVPGRTQEVVGCLRIHDGATPAGGSFRAGAPAAMPDAVEIIYATAPMTVATAAPVLGPAPSVQVADVSKFSVGDLVLLSDYEAADLFRVSAITPGVGSGGTLHFGVLGGPVLSPAAPALSLGAGCAVFGARSLSLYVGSAGALGDVLLLDPDGLAGADHSDAQPLVAGVTDLQLAVAQDDGGDGIGAENGAGAGLDEWRGNVAGELPLPAPPWNRPGTTDPQLRLVRATLLLRTRETFPGAPPTLGPYEDRTSYPAAATTTPRYRPLRVVVAPRAWNLTE